MFDWTTLVDTLETPIKLLTAHQDDSHGYNHVLAVVARCKQIVGTREFLCLRNGFTTKDASTVLTQNTIDRIIIGAMMHDVMDHKYEQPFDIIKIRAMFMYRISTEQMEFAEWIMRNNSWSKEMKGLTEWHPKYYFEQAVIQDADRLEALGEGGVMRCSAYNGGDMALVRQHCLDKLIKIPQYMRYSSTLRIIADENLMGPINDLL